MFEYLNSNYSNKIDSCIKSLKEFEILKVDLAKKYQKVFFRGSEIEKLETFLNLLNFKRIDAKTVTYLNSKCDNLKHFKDRRQGFEYAVDLMLGWLIEDGVALFLNKNNVKTSLGGTDSNREFLTFSEISATPDLIIDKDITQNIEVFCDWSNTWARYNHADFRDQKFQKLKQKNSLVLGISPKNSLGFLIDVLSQTHLFQHTKNIRGYGGKSGYTIHGIRTYLLPISRIKSDLIFKFSEI
jgi:hypothetical protein